MDRFSLVAFSRFLLVITAVCLAALSPPILADETEHKTPDPGFRPDSEYASAFLESLDTATVAVYPSVIRRVDRTAHSFASQQQVVAFLETNTMFTVVAGPTRFDLGRLVQQSQWDTFRTGLSAIAAAKKSHQADADYSLVMEILVPGDQAVFGIQCYVLDQQGHDAFSFLLNSHHQLFVDANLIAKNSSEAARARMIEKATQVGLTALAAQIEQARASALHPADTGSTPAGSGTVAGEKSNK